MGGERAVANHDEDSLTLAVNAALGCAAAGTPDVILFASTTPPYREKQSAVTIATVLDVVGKARTSDLTDSLRAGTSAVLAGLDALAGGARTILVSAADCRLGEPDSISEQFYGDAGAAVVLGDDNVLAEILATASVSQELLGTWRAEEQKHLHGFPGGFETKLGYVPAVREAIVSVLQKAAIEAEFVDVAAIAAPNPKSAMTAAAAAGLDPLKQLHDTFWRNIGDTGAAQPLLLLAAALERAKPGQTILAVGYGDGADAILLRTTAALSAYQPARGVFKQIETKRTLPSYGRYARFRGLVRKDPPPPDVSTPVTTFRDQKSIFALQGVRCSQCETVQFPRQEVCIECSHRGDLSPVSLSRRGMVFTFTNDYVAEAAETPVANAVVDLDGGGRLYVQVTDCNVEDIEIEMPVELTFRRIHQGFGMNNYFWKARPAA
jgi:3-hydroxy-3-methylglutaryl CoA synthase